MSTIFYLTAALLLIHFSLWTTIRSNIEINISQYEIVLTFFFQTVFDKVEQQSQINFLCTAGN